MYTHDHQEQNILIIDCFGSANVMNNTTIINIFNSDNTTVTYIDIKHCQIIATMTYIMLKIKRIIEKPIVLNHTFFAVATFTRMNSFAYINSFVIQHL